MGKSGNPRCLGGLGEEGVHLKLQGISALPFCGLVGVGRWRGDGAAVSTVRRQWRTEMAGSVRWSGFGQEEKRAEGCREGVRANDLKSLPAGRARARAARRRHGSGRRGSEEERGGATDMRARPLFE